MHLLHKLHGIVNFEPLEPLIMRCLQGSHIVMQEPSGSVTFAPNLLEKEGHATQLAKPILTLEMALQELEAAFLLTTEGKFAEAMKLFVNVLHSCLFIVVENEIDESKLKEVIATCRSYLLALNFEQLRKACIATDPERSLALACYFAYCDMNREHEILALRSALTQAYKLQCFALSGRLAKLLLQCEPAESIASQAQKIVALSDKLPLSHVDPISIIGGDGVIIDSRDAIPITDGSYALCYYYRLLLTFIWVVMGSAVGAGRLRVPAARSRRGVEPHCRDDAGAGHGEPGAPAARGDVGGDPAPRGSGGAVSGAGRQSVLLGRAVHEGARCCSAVSTSI